MPYRTITVFFHLDKSSIQRIINKELETNASTITDYVNCNKIQLEQHPNWPNTIGIIDSTEIYIQTWQPKAFSGKAKRFTLMGCPESCFNFS